MTDFKLVNMPQGPGSQMVVLDRVSPLGTQPPYCVHGKTKCMVCQHWVWLGDNTYDLVSKGKAAPICMECATEHASRDQYVGRVNDSPAGEDH